MASPIRYTFTISQKGLFTEDRFLTQITDAKGKARYSALLPFELEQQQPNITYKTELSPKEAAQALLSKDQLWGPRVGKSLGVFTFILSATAAAIFLKAYWKKLPTHLKIEPFKIQKFNFPGFVFPKIIVQGMYVGAALATCFIASVVFGFSANKGTEWLRTQYQIKKLAGILEHPSSSFLQKGEGEPYVYNFQENPETPSGHWTPADNLEKLIEQLFPQPMYKHQPAHKPAAAEAP